MENKRKTLIILPGWGGDRTTWEKFIEQPKKKFSTICIDLPCFGSEPCPSEVWGIEEYSNFVEKKIIALQIDRPILLGHSFGGQVAVKLASSGRLPLAGLVLCAPPVYRPANLIRRSIFYLPAKIGKLFFRIPLTQRWSPTAKNLFHRLIGAQDYEKSSGINREIFRKVIREDVSHSLPRITTPTLIVWGTRDRYVPVRYAKKIASAIPKADLKFIPGGNHGLHLQQPEALLAHIENFVCSLPS